MTTEKLGTGPGSTCSEAGGTTNLDTTDENTRAHGGTRAADLRFILPAPPRTALVLGSPEIAAALALSGVELLMDRASQEPDLVVTGHAGLGRAIGSGATSIVVTAATGRRATQRLDCAGYTMTRLLVRRGPSGPRMLVPTRGAALGFALRHWMRPPGRLRGLRNDAVAALVGSGVRLPRAIMTLATRTPGPPWPIARAAPPSMGADPSWMFVPGTGDELQRAVFHIFSEESAQPSWVLKLARVPAYRAPFEADEHGLRLARAAGPLTAARAPAFLGLLDLDGLAGSIESAARGRPLNELLAASGSVRSKRLAIESVAEWIVSVGSETAQRPDSLDTERERLCELGSYAAEVVSALPPVPGVLAHHDLGSWNIACAPGGSDFTVLDWESARRPAMPLWDLLYFLTDSLLALEGQSDDDSRLRAALTLLRGEHHSSPMLFRWVRTYADALGLDPSAVGPLATLCWIHHASSRARRTAALRESTIALTTTPTAEPWLHARIAGPWSSDPALGIYWPARRA